MNAVLHAIRASRAIAIIRAKRADRVLEAVDAIAEAGITAIEVTITTPGAIDLIRRVTAERPDVTFGAGTVLDAAAVSACVNAGARFIVSPNTRLETIHAARRHGVPVFPGAYTPTEILEAWEAGADAVKVFPAPDPAYVRAVHAPLPQVPLVPTGGVTIENAAEYLRAGAFALGVGGSLVNDALLERGDIGGIRERARRLRAAVDEVPLEP